MPIYEYKCQNCSYQFEYFQKTQSELLSNCPECRGKVEKLISQTSFSLKGRGWFKDGYTKEKPKETKVQVSKAPSDQTKKEPSSNPVKGQKSG